jgi:alpha-D-ribose 1-methylphosphonate 5-triphosphate synthase subunit PhnH
MTYDPGFDEVRESQRVFRRLLEASAWPGKVEKLPATRVSPPPSWPAAVIQVARTLLDSQVTFAVHGEAGPSLFDYLRTNTGARPAPLPQASYVIAGPPLAALDVAALHPGTLLEPDRGATVLLACELVLDRPEQPGQPPRPNGSAHPAGRFASDLVALNLRGRGIADRRTLVVDRDTAAALARLAEREDEYPLGVDLILADHAGRLVSLPRTTRWSKEAIAWAT